MWWRRFRYSVAKRFFDDIIEAEVADAINLEKGWIWKENCVGGVLIKQVSDECRKQGYTTALKDVKRLFLHNSQEAAIFLINNLLAGVNVEDKQ